MRWVRSLALSLVFGALVLTAFALYGDAPRLLETARSYPPGILAPVLALTSLNYALRWVKWRYYLRLVGARSVRGGDSVLIFLSGFAMGLTPGKVGELVKPYFLKERYGFPISQTSPIPLAERLTDGIALILLAAAGVLIYGIGLAAIVAILAVAVAALVTVRSALARAALLAIAARLPLIGARTGAVQALFDSAALLLSWRPLLLAVGLGVISWGCESVAFLLILAGLGLPTSPTLLVQAAFALASATLFGSASLLPGGLGVAEASLTGFLELVVGLSRSHAVYATLLIRLCTLWFGVLLGALALLALVARRVPASEAPGGPLVDLSGPLP